LGLRGIRRLHDENDVRDPADFFGVDVDVVSTDIIHVIAGVIDRAVVDVEGFDHGGKW
jgi:hypothetical protein